MRVVRVTERSGNRSRPGPVSRSRAVSRRAAGLVTLVLTLLVAGCSEDPVAQRAGPHDQETVRRSPAATTTTPAVPSPPTPAPSTPTPLTPASTVTVTIVGDIMLGRRVGDRLERIDDFAAPLRPTARRLAAADITVGNLESTLAQLGPPRQGNDSFAAHPRVRSGLRLAGFDVLSLANNHTGDYGSRSLVETLRLLRRGGFVPVGAGANARQAWRPAIVERKGVRFGFLAFNAIGETPRAGADTPGAASVAMQPRTGPLSRADLARATRAVRALRREVDVVIVLPHWGDQYTHQPVRDQRRVGRALLDAGADLVVGGHPHWIQTVERHRGKPLVHSLGNFIFDMGESFPDMPQVREGVVLEARFAGSRLAATRFVPYVIGDDYAPRWVSGKRARAILADLRVDPD